MASVFTIAAGAPFADTLVRGFLARIDTGDPLALSRVGVYLPTRRGARVLSESFARAMGGAALLPDIHALGELDEDEFLLDPSVETLDLRPAIAPVRERLLLATLVQRWDRARGGDLNFAQAASLARGLASFFNEVETQKADLSKLEELAPASLAEHWAQVKEFLSLLRDQWPALLADENVLSPAARRNESLAALARRFADHPPDGPVIAAGSTGSIPATAELLRVIANLPKGAVVLPGLDRELDEKSWLELDAGHPQFGIKQMLLTIGVARNDVRDWNDASPMHARETLLREVLRPAPTTDAWRALAAHGGGEIAKGLEGLSIVEAAHPGEEAASIALMLREVLETKDKTAALVTPDRNLARRVAAELGRWNIAIDDSAGRPLSHTPPGTFLILLAEAAEAEFAPVPLLALLKHPLCAHGMAPGDFRARVREFDRFALRGARPDPGLGGIEKAIEQTNDKNLSAWFANVATVLKPLQEISNGREIAISDAIAAHIKVGEELAATDEERGPTRLYRGPAGEAAAALISEMSEASADLPLIDFKSYAALFASLAQERAIRPAFGRHPRLSILGPLEARLQNFDLIVLGGLNEGTWPAAAPADAWLSRPMRKTLGLEQPERRIGLAAHDFSTLAAGPRVVLTRALKEEGSPAVASRWLQRIVQLCKGLELGKRLESHAPYAAYAAALDAVDGSKPIAPPAPRPPVAARPRKLSVTEIETWVRDPYAIYARRVLKLEPLDPLDAEIGPLERGSAIHLALERFVARYAHALPQDAEDRLIAEAQSVFREQNTPAATLALWLPRFRHAAHAFIEIERRRRENIARSHLELKGERKFAAPAGEFLLYGRADRIDELKSGGAAIVDYKTGKPPTGKQVESLLAPQLPLEGAILESGGFGIGKLKPEELLYIHFAGTKNPVEERAVKGDVAALSAEAAKKLSDRIAFFDDPATPYLSRVRVEKAHAPGDYDHLARVREWSLTGWEDGE
jgi:ATP-dependent helicase/nuclease subunit B